MVNKQANPDRKVPPKDHARWGIIGLLVLLLVVVGLFVFGGQRLLHKPSDKQISDDYSAMSAEQKQQGDKVFRKYLVGSINSKTKYSAESYTPSSDPTSTAVVTGREGYDLAKNSVTTSLSYTCTAKVDNADIALGVTVQTQNTDTYVRLNKISGQGTELAATNAKAKGIWYKVGEPNAVIQAELDSGVFVFGSGVLAPNYDAQNVADALIRNNAYGYVLDRHKDDTYTFDITARRDNYAAALKQAFPNLASMDLILGALFPDNATDLESSLTIKEDGTAVNELGLRSDACPDEAKLFLGPAGTQDARTPGMRKALTVNKTPDESFITPITRWKPVAQYGQ